METRAGVSAQRAEQLCSFDVSSVWTMSSPWLLCCRPPYGVPHGDEMGCCGPGPEVQPDEGALLSQLCSVLKDYEGLEEIDKMLGIPTLAGQVDCLKVAIINKLTKLKRTIA